MSKTNFNQRLSSPSLWLVLGLIVIVMWEGYLLYSLFAENFSGQITAPLPGAIVRLDLNSYNTTLTLLQFNQNFIPQPLDLANPNPFK